MTYEGAHGSIGPLLDGLGASVTAVAIISGLGEMIAASLRFFSGRLADRTHAYWTLAITGYALNVIAIPALAFVDTWQAAAVLITIERTGKAIRGPARDLLLSEATGTVGHGWGFGLHAVMDQTGAFAGPLLMAILAARYGRIGPTFAWLAIPAALALASILLARAVRPVRVEPPPTKAPAKLPAVFWPYVAAAGLLACGFIDFPVLAAHFERTGVFAPATIPLLYSAAMAMNGLTAFVFGRLFDKHGLVVLAGGIIFSVLALPLGFFGGAAGGVLAVAVLGQRARRAGRVAARGHRAGCFDEQARHRVRHVQRRLRRDVVPGECGDGMALRHLHRRARHVRRGGAVGGRGHVLLAATAPRGGEPRRQLTGRIY